MNGLQGKSPQKTAKKPVRLLVACALAAVSSAAVVSAAANAKARFLEAFTPSIPLGALTSAPVHASARWSFDQRGAGTVAATRTRMLTIAVPSAAPLIAARALSPTVETSADGRLIQFAFHQPLVIEFHELPETMVANRGERPTNRAVRHDHNDKMSGVRKIQQQQALNAPAAQGPMIQEAPSKPRLAVVDEKDSPKLDYPDLVTNFGLTNVPKLDDVVSEASQAHWAQKEAGDDAKQQMAQGGRDAASSAFTADTRYVVTLTHVGSQNTQDSQGAVNEPSPQQAPQERTSLDSRPMHAAVAIPAYRPIFDIAAAQATPLQAAASRTEEKQKETPSAASASVSTSPAMAIPVIIAGAPGPAAPAVTAPPAAAPAAPAQPAAPPAARSESAGSVGDRNLGSSISSLQEALARKSTVDETPVAPQQAGEFQGRVFDAFSDGSRPVANVRVQIVGSPQTTSTDAEGVFRFDGVDVDGVLPVMLSKDGYRWRRIDLQKGREYNVELASDNAVRIANLASGDTTKAREGFLFGQIVDHGGGPLAGYKVELQGANDGQNIGVKPSYMDRNGAPSKQATYSSDRGQFLFSSVPVGTYLLIMTDAFGRERASHVVRVGAGEGIVRKYSAGTELRITGRLINGQTTSSPVSGAEVRLLGSSVKVLSDRDGRFDLGDIYVDCDELNYLQMERPDGFYRNRFEYSCSSGDSPSYYPMPMSRIHGMASEASVNLSDNESFIVGHVGYRFPTKAQLIGPEEMEPSEAPRGYDFYFGEDGVVTPSRGGTSRGGNFIITGAPAELSYLQVFDMKDRTRLIKPILGAPDTVNVTIH